MSVEEVNVSTETQDLEITISHCQEKDAAAIIAYLKVVMLESHFLTFSGGPLPYDVEYKVNLIRRLKNEANGVLMCVKLRESGEIVSLGTCFSQGRTSSHVFSLGITVKKAHWRKQIGYRLTKQMISESEKLGAEKISLRVAVSNERAVSLYRRLGFTTEGMLVKECKTRDGQYLDLYEMALFL